MAHVHEGASTAEEHAGLLRQRGAAPADKVSSVMPVQEQNDCGEMHGTDCVHVQRGPPEDECCDVLMMRPRCKLSMLALVAVVPLFGSFVPIYDALSKLGWTDYSAYVLNYALAFWLSTQFLYNFVMAQRSDAGSAIGVKPVHESTGQFELKFIVDGIEETVRYAPSWCPMCKSWKPPRTHHCSRCKRCVVRMDHHCPFLGNCIGAKNQGHFILMYLFAIIGCIYSIVLCSSAIHHSWAHRDFSGYLKQKRRSSSTRQMGMGEMNVMDDFYLNHNMVMEAFVLSLTTFPRHLIKNAGFPLLIQVATSVVALICSICPGVDALCVAFGGATTLECIYPKKEYLELGPGDYYPLDRDFYSRARFYQNLRDLLGHNWWLRLLLPVRGRGMCPTTAELGRGWAPKPELVQRVREARMKRAGEDQGSAPIAIGVAQPDRD